MTRDKETYHSLTGGTYEPFNGIVLTDTFQMNEADDELDGQGVFPENNHRVETQKALDIRVIIGNPPYSKGQDSNNDDNRNNKYPTLDLRISETYAKNSAAVNKNNLYDSYIRSIRWASDRIGDAGVIAFVSNGGFIDANTAEGLRKCLVEEFTSVYVLNLRGNARTSGEQRRKEKDNVFGQGTRTSIAVYLLVKNPARQRNGTVKYHDIGDYLSRDEKLAKLRDFGSMSSVDWVEISPNDSGDWINQRDASYLKYQPLGHRDQNSGETAVFEVFSRGVLTARDAWLYNFSEANLARNVASMVEFYNEQVDEASNWAGPGQWKRDNDTKKISWNAADDDRLRQGQKYDVAAGRVVDALYRPFTKSKLWLDSKLLDRTYQIPKLFPTPELSNIGINVTAPGTGRVFAALMVDLIPDVCVTGQTGQVFARYRFEKVSSNTLFEVDAEVENGYKRFDNIRDFTLTRFQNLLGSEVTKDDIFYYIYGLLYSRRFREEFESDLVKIIPRIPIAREFFQIAKVGRNLAALHTGYETVEKYPLDVDGIDSGDFEVRKMRYVNTAKTTDKTGIVFNSKIRVSGIPALAHEFKIGTRSALDWLVERYQYRIDAASGLVDDPNSWCQGENNAYILDLIQRVTTVSVRTQEAVDSLPNPRFFEE